MSLALLVTVCLIIMFMFVSFWRRGGLIPEGPALLTMVGIAGTFLGIAVGLASFDSDDISGSVPRLIDGMKVAVWASFAGVLSAIVLKYRDAVLAARQSDIEGFDGDDIVERLFRLIGSGDNTSVLTELKLLRRDLGERISRVEYATRLNADSASGQPLRPNAGTRSPVPESEQQKTDIAPMYVDSP